MRVVDIDRRWHAAATIAALAALAIGSATVFAAPRSGGGDTEPPDGGDSGEPTRDPIDRPGRPTKPQIPGYVLTNDAYYRERTLPLCEWAAGERGFYDQFIRDDGDHAWWWTCTADSVPSRDPQTGEWLNNTCAWSGPPIYRPTDAKYTLRPFNYWENWNTNLEWADGTAAYGGWGVTCSMNPSSTTDTVLGSTFEGTYLNGNTCPGWPNQGRRAHLIAQVVGGDVEHVRPAIVRALANVGYYAYSGPRNLSGDLVLAIQVFGSAGWQDVATVTRTTGPQPMNIELEATVPEGSFVRMQLRGTEQCIGGHHDGDGYDIRSLRIQVETCVPDQSNPGQCL